MLKRARVANDPPLAGSREAITSSNVAKSSVPPCAGSAQTSSSLKSGAISPMRQACFSCSLFGILMSVCLGREQLGLHRLGQRERPRQRPDHHDELVDQPVLTRVQEVAPIELAIADACAENEGVFAGPLRTNLAFVAEVFEHA